jgi:thioesterase-3
MKTQTIIKARGYHTDQFGHVNHARFIELLEEGRWCYMEENGLLDLFHSMGLGHVVIRIAVDYKNSVRAGDTMRIETGLIKRGRSSFTMGQNIYLDTTGIQVLEAQIVNVFIDGKSGKAVVPDRGLVSKWHDLAMAGEKEDANG